MCTNMMIKKIKRMLVLVCLLRRDPLVRVQLKHLLQQVDRCKVNISREDHIILSLWCSLRGGQRPSVLYSQENIFLLHTSRISNFSNCLIFDRFIFLSDLIWLELTKWIGPLKNFVQVFLLHLGKWSDVVSGLHSAHGNVIDDWERQNQETRSWKSSFRGKQKTNKTITW